MGTNYIEDYKIVASLLFKSAINLIEISETPDSTEAGDRFLYGCLTPHKAAYYCSELTQEQLNLVPGIAATMLVEGY